MIVIEPPSTDSNSEGLFAGLQKLALKRFLLRSKIATGISGEVTVLLCDDARIKGLNKTFRGKNKATDVLSFPAGENAEGIVGDLAISVETTARQATEQGHTLQEELHILMLHGMLHLAGFDHETDTGEMRHRETELRVKLKLPAGLIERTVPAPKKAKSPAKSSLGSRRGER